MNTFNSSVCPLNSGDEKGKKMPFDELAFADVDSLEIINQRDTNTIETGRFLYAKNILMLNKMADIMRETINKLIPNLHNFLKRELPRLRREIGVYDLVRRCDQLLDDGTYITPELFHISDLYSLIRFGIDTECTEPTSVHGIVLNEEVMGDFERINVKVNQLIIHHSTGKLDGYTYRRNRDDIKEIALRLQTFLGISGLETQLDAISSTTKSQAKENGIIKNTIYACLEIEALGGKLCSGLNGYWHKDWQDGRFFAFEEDERLSVLAVTDSKTINEKAFGYMKIILMIHILAVMERRMIRKYIPDLGDFFTKHKLDIEDKTWAYDLRERPDNLKHQGKLLTPELFDLSNLYLIIRIGMNIGIYFKGFLPPNLGWGKCPTLVTFGDYIERVRDTRNRILGHHVTGKLEISEYIQEREEIRIIVKRLEKDLGDAENEYGVEIDEIDAAGIHNEKKVKAIENRFYHVCRTTMAQGETFGPALRRFNEQRQDELENLRRENRELKDKLSYRKSEEELKEKIEELNKKIQKQNSEIATLRSGLDNAERDNEWLKQDLQQVRSRRDELLRSRDEKSTEIEKLRREVNELKGKIEEDIGATVVSGASIGATIGAPSGLPGAVIGGALGGACDGAVAVFSKLFK